MQYDGLTTHVVATAFEFSYRLAQRIPDLSYTVVGPVDTAGHLMIVYLWEGEEVMGLGLHALNLDPTEGLNIELVSLPDGNGISCGTVSRSHVVESAERCARLLRQAKALRQCNTAIDRATGEHAHMECSLEEDNLGRDVLVLRRGHTALKLLEVRSAERSIVLLHQGQRRVIQLLEDGNIGPHSEQGMRNMLLSLLAE